MAPKMFSRYLAFNQNIVSGMVVFFSAGIYLAVLGLGAGGGKPSSQRVSDITNCSLYAVTAVFGFFTGSILNSLGPRWTMAIGAAGYPFYVAGLFYYDRTGGQAFPIVGGIILGFCCPLMWNTAMAVQWSYATEAEKGLYITVQFLLNAMGSIIGSLVAFIIILKGATTSEGSPTAVYITFLVLMLLGFVTAALGLVSPGDVQRSDGTHVAVFRVLPYKDELKGVWEAIKEPRIIAMLVVAICTEFPVSIMPILNAHYFSLRTRALNSVLFDVMFLPSAPAFMYLLDKLPFGRTKRGLISLGVATVIMVTAWICLICWVCISKTFANPPLNGVDWTDENFAGPFVLYLVFGVVFTVHQLIGMWTMATLTNEPRKLGIYGGVWRGISGGGLAITFGLSAGHVSYKNQVIFMMSLQFLSLIIMAVIITKYSGETNYGKEVNVIVPHYAEEKYHVKTILEDDLLEGIPGLDVDNANTTVPTTQVEMKN